jgi:hypothetical protein
MLANSTVKVVNEAFELANELLNCPSTGCIHMADQPGVTTDVSRPDALPLQALLLLTNTFIVRSGGWRLKWSGATRGSQMNALASDLTAESDRRGWAAVKTYDPVSQAG